MCLLILLFYLNRYLLKLSDQFIKFSEPIIGPYESLFYLWDCEVGPIYFLRFVGKYI